MTSIPLTLLTPANSFDLLSQQTKLSPEQKLLDVNPTSTLVVSDGQHVSHAPHACTPAHGPLKRVLRSGSAPQQATVHKVLCTQWQDANGESLLAVVYAEAVDVHAVQTACISNAASTSGGAHVGCIAAPNGIRIRACAWHPEHAVLAVASQSGVALVSCAPQPKGSQPPAEPAAGFAASGACTILSTVRLDQPCRSLRVCTSWVSPSHASGAGESGTLLVDWGSDGTELLTWEWSASGACGIHNLHVSNRSAVPAACQVGALTGKMHFLAVLTLHQTLHQ